MIWKKAEPYICDKLAGLVVKTIDVASGGDDDGVLITTECGRQFRFQHLKDCCECVQIVGQDGDIKTLEGQRLVAVEHWEKEDEDPPNKEYNHSWTWTNLVFQTTADTVAVRWLGESNGYYSETVSLCEITT